MIDFSLMPRRNKTYAGKLITTKESIRGIHWLRGDSERLHEQP